MAVVDHVGSRTIPILLAERVEANPDKQALVFEDASGALTEYTYAALSDAVHRVASGFEELGVEAGDRAVICMPNRAEFVIAILALAHLGAVGVPANTTISAKELTHVVGRSQAKLALVSAQYVELVDAVSPDLPTLERVIVVGLADPAPHLPFAQLLAADPLARSRRIDSEAPIEIIFTSGTTALPKGVVLTHANWIWSGERSTHWVRIDDRDRLFSALPLFHVNAQSFTLLAALTVGATAIFAEAYSASNFIDQVRRHRATHTSLVAMLVRTLLAQPESPHDRDHQLRRISYAINVSDAEKQSFEERFGVELLNGYGLTEAMTEVAVCPVFGERRWPSIGRPALGREVRLLDADGNEVPTGEAGEIAVKGVPGRTILKEYLDDPEATARAIVDGWLLTGDNGRFDEDGFLYWVDRAKDMIKRAGENVSASEVEVAIAEHPEVDLVAVIGVPDALRDEAVMAFVTPKPGATLTEDDVIAHCRELLASFKVPTLVEIRETLPTTSIGKVEKKLLRPVAPSPDRGPEC